MNNKGGCARKLEFPPPNCSEQHLMNVSDLLARARSAAGRKTEYKLGKGGMKPLAALPDAGGGQCDCSGYVAWALGISRKTDNPFYKNVNGGWIETTAVHKDIASEVGLFSPCPAQLGCIVVYGDAGGGQGHIGIVTATANKDGELVASKVLHCSSGNWKKNGDSVLETPANVFTNNPRTVYGWYEGIDRNSLAETMNIEIRRALAVDPSAATLAPGATWPSPVIVHQYGTPSGYVPIWGCLGEAARFCQAGMMINADGAPNAYNPADTGTDYLRNAGAPPRDQPNAPHSKWRWWGIATRNGAPVVQNSGPWKGYYVSTTALVNAGQPDDVPARYVDSDAIPFIVVPGVERGRALLGDYAFIVNRGNGQSSPAIVADLGPKDKIGEGSIELARRLGIRENPRRGGTSKPDIFYIIFPGTGKSRGQALAKIEQNANELFETWGGMERLATLPRLIPLTA